MYDQVLGSNIRRPFLHVRYRASQSDDRRMKSWLTGSAGGAFTSTLDAMEVNAQLARLHTTVITL